MSIIQHALEAKVLLGGQDDGWEKVAALRKEAERSAARGDSFGAAFNDQQASAMAERLRKTHPVTVANTRNEANMVRDIPTAVKMEVDYTYGRSRAEQERRMMIAFRAVNGWDLDRFQAFRENMKGGPIIVLLAALRG